MVNQRSMTLRMPLSSTATLKVIFVLRRAIDEEVVRQRVQGFGGTLLSFSLAHEHEAELVQALRTVA